MQILISKALILSDQENVVFILYYKMFPMEQEHKLSNRTVHVNERLQNKNKTKHVKFNLTTGSIVRFNPQH